jgi:hypothetical protein
VVIAELGMVYARLGKKEDANEDDYQLELQKGLYDLVT